MSQPAAESLHARRLRWREVSRTAGQAELRVALLASYTIEPIVPCLGLGLHDAGITASVTTGPFDQVVQACADPGSAIARLEPHVVVIAQRLADLMRPGSPVAPAVVEARMRVVADTALRVADRWDSQLVVVCPAAADVAADARAPLRPALAAYTERLRHRAGVDVISFDDLVAEFGVNNTYHPEMLAHARIPYREPVFAALADRVVRAISGQLDVRTRAVLVDLDSLFRHGGGDDQTGAMSLVSALSSFRAAGGSIAVRARLDRVPPGPVSRRLLSNLADLADVWLPGSGPVAGQLAEAALLAGGSEGNARLLTADPAPSDGRPDGPALRLPTVASDWCDFLSSALCGPGPGAARLRPVATESAMDLASFVAGLGIRVTCTPLAVHEAAVSADFARRNVDFCLAPAPTAADLAASAADSAQEVWLVKVADRMGEYGSSGLVRLWGTALTCVIDVFSLSCAVLGRGVESQIMAEIRGWAERRGCSSITVRMQHTGRNGAAADYFVAAAKEERKGGSIILQIEEEAAE
jgi:hypothetical protein